MNSRNVKTKMYIGRNDKFADLCNFFLFSGKPIIRPEDLEEKDVTELGVPFSDKGSQAVERIRDLLRACTIKSVHGITYLVIGIENQSEIHYAMVVRNMVQDPLNYAAQAEAYAKQHRKEKDLKGAEFLSGFSKEDKLVPVVTIVVYWNFGPWDGPRSLHEMFDVSYKEVLDFVPDYRLNLVVPDEIEDFDKFSTELGPVLEFCQCADNREKLKKLWNSKRETGFFLEKDSVEVINECVNAGFDLPEEGVKADMCQGLKDWLEEMRQEGLQQGYEEGLEMGCEQGLKQGMQQGLEKGLEKGLEQGLEQGEARMSRLVNALLSENKIQEIGLVTSDVKVRAEYYALYNI